MIRRLIILLLIVGCDMLQEEDVYGCTDANASNFDSNANIFDNSCEYSVSSEFTDFETIQGMDESGNPTEIVGDGIWGNCGVGWINPEGSVSMTLPVTNVLMSPITNPCSPGDNILILYAITKESEVNLYIINKNYAIIKTLVNESQTTGYHSIMWNGEDDVGAIPDNDFYRVILQLGDSVCFANLHITNPL